jgi:autotransporter-associated beta strand protein
MAPTAAARLQALFRSLAALAFVWAAGLATALDVTGYSPTTNDRFSSGFPSSPVPNANPSFVGAGYDWSGVGWSTTDPTKGFGFITPRHYLVARHYGGAATITLRGPDGTLRTGTQASVTNTGYGAVFSGQTLGDLSIGKLVATMPANWQVARYAVLDLNGSSSVNLSYNGQSLLVYGKGSSGTVSPRIGAATINGTVLSGSNSYVSSSLTGSPSVQFQVGDSGSPIFIPWQNPAGGQQLTILGNNAAYDSSNAYYNYVANAQVMSAINAITTPDGYALRVQGNPNAVWTGSTSSSLWIVGNWNENPVDQYAAFQAGGTAPTSISVDNAANMRGLAFTATGSTGSGFTFSGPQTVMIGRGGLTNYTSLRQTFSSTVALGSHQYWDVGAGGVTANAINTNGRLLEIAGTGTARITGAVSGTGGLALSGTRLELSGSSTYSGGTWVHAGTLAVDGTIAASSGVSVAYGAELGGSGLVASISGSGLVGPGNSPGILTAPSVSPAGGLDFAFELNQKGAPTWANAAASGNDVLRLTDATTPFTASLTAANVINVFFGASSLAYGDAFRGGFFTDRSQDFWSILQNATFAYYVRGDGLGMDATYNGLGYYTLDTDFWAAFERVDVSTVSVASADFAGGTVTNGQVMQFFVVPEPGGLPLAALGVIAMLAIRRGRRSGFRKW